MSRLVLIDGNAILHRAFHALPPMTNSKGQQTNAVYGFISILINVIAQLKPTHLVVTFDRPKPTFRKKLYKNYQAHRPEMVEAMVGQIGLIHQVVEAMRIPIFEVDGYEADDVIGTIAKEAIGDTKYVTRQKNIPHITSHISPINEVIVVTGDRDLLQLVNSHVKLFMPIKGLTEAKLFGEKEAKERMGVMPKLIPDLKGLMGDPSDNYPGVVGIGPKTAVSLLERFGSIVSIYKNLDKIQNSTVAEKLQQGKEDAFLSLKLATIVTDVPITFNVSEAKIPDLVNQKVLNVFGELEFKTLLKRLLKVSAGENSSLSKKPNQPVIREQTDDQLGLF